MPMTPVPPVATPRTHDAARRARATLRAARVACLAAIAAACSDQGAGDVPVGPVDPNAPLAEGTIGPDGGRVEVTSGPHRGVALTVQPGVLQQDRYFVIALEHGESSVPSLFPVYRFEPADLVFAPMQAAVSVRAATPFFAAGGPHTPLALFSRNAQGAPFDVLPFTVVDEAMQTVSASAERLGRFVATNAALHRLFSQELDLVDPSKATRVQDVGGVEITIANGDTTMFLGRGSLDAFWSAPAGQNVLILHGLSRTPLDFRGPLDLPVSLAPSVQNVVLVVYPSALGVEAIANSLYDLVRARQQPGFGCTIIGHSLGGNIARYMLEQSAGDTSRSGYQPTDQPLSDVVPTAFLIGTPNGGSNIACELLALLHPNLPPADARFARAGLDLLEGANTFAQAQIAAYTDNPTVYHSIVGDIGNGTDGIVTLASTRALPRFPPEEEVVFVQTHLDLHRAAAVNGVAAWINARLPQ